MIALFFTWLTGFVMLVSASLVFGIRPSIAEAVVVTVSVLVAVAVYESLR